MSIVGRGTMPQNYLDFLALGVNPMLRLKTPEPQYFFAQALLGSRIGSNALKMAMEPRDWAMAMAGGNGAVLPAGLDRLIRYAEAFPQIVQTVEELDGTKGKGDTIKLERDVFTGGGYTTADRKKTPGKTTSTTGLVITGEEVPMVLEHYRGPFGASGTEPQPYVVDEFDNKFRANKEALASRIFRHLHRDRVKFLDTVVRDLFRATTNITYADGVANVLSMTAAAGHTANLEMVKRARKSINDREWQPFANGNYLFLVPTEFDVQMIADPDWIQYTKAHGGGSGNPIFGKIAQVDDVEIIQVTTLKTYAAGDTVPGDGNAVPSGATVYEGLMIGPGAVGYAVAQDAESRFSDSTDYGASASIIWDSKESFKTLDVRGIQRVLFQNAS
jgi:hypothetical protein